MTSNELTTYRYVAYRITETDLEAIMLVFILRREAGTQKILELVQGQKQNE